MTQLDEKPIIAVCGGLGDQGGSVVKYLLEEEFFTIRILTRNKNSPRAKNAAARGIEIVQADYDDPESLIQAFEGAYGVFAVTDYFECGFEREKQQGFNLVDAAKACNVQHFIWSSLEHSDLKIPHFESKADIDDYLKASGVPRTSLFLTFYYSNVFVMGFDRTPDGTYHMNWLYPTDAALPSIDVDDVGAWVTAAFMDPEEWIGKDMKPCSEFITPRQYASTFEEISGHTVVMREVSYDDFMSQKDIPYPYNLWSNMKWFLDQGKRARDPNLAKRLHSRLRNWREFVISHLNVPPPPALEIPMSVEVSVQS